MKKLIGDEIQLKGSLWLGYYQPFHQQCDLIQLFRPQQDMNMVVRLSNC
jgi:hypothetical protein